jgi:hypothetical protein
MAHISNTEVTLTLTTEFLTCGKCGSLVPEGVRAQVRTIGPPLLTYRQTLDAVAAVLMVKIQVAQNFKQLVICAFRLGGGDPVYLIKDVGFSQSELEPRLAELHESASPESEIVFV